MGSIRTVVRNLLVRAVAISCAGLVGGAASPVSADVIDDYQGPWSVSLFSDDEDVLDDASVDLGPPNSDLFVADQGNSLYFEITDATDPLEEVEISVVADETLREGFTRSQLSFRNPEAFYYDFTGAANVAHNGSSCPADQAHVDIRELHRSNGVIDRLWLIFEQRCRGAPRALFGEIRLGMPASPVEAMPRVVRWPATTVVGGANKVVPVRVATQSGAVGNVTASIHGRDADRFRIMGSTCVDPGLEACLVRVAFRSRHTGPARGRLRLDTGQGTTTVPLSGFGQAGVSRLVMQSEAGDYLGDGKSYWLDAAEGGVLAYGSRTRVHAWAEEGDWNIYLEPPDGEVLRVGEYPGTASASVNHPGPVLRVNGEGRGCGYSHGRFEILRAKYVAPGRLSALDLRFVYYCEASGAALKGRYRWNSRRDLRGPSPVKGVSASRRGDGWRLSWQNPLTDDFARTEVRWYHGTSWPSQIPDVGWPAVRPSGRSAVIDPDGSGPVIVSIFAIDETGNVGPARTVVLQ